jgi:hypothetical protein
MAQHHYFSDQSSVPRLVDDTEHFRALREALKDATTTAEPGARRHRRTSLRSRLLHLVHRDS